MKDTNMENPLHRLLGVFSVLALLLLPTFALAQRQLQKRPSPHKTDEQLLADSIFVLKPMSLGCELPGAHLQLVVKGVALDPMEACEHISLKDAKQTHILQSLNDLHGHVSIADGPTALRYVRLLTSPETWFLWGQQPVAVEILEARDALTLPNFGLNREPRFLSSFPTPAGTKGGLQMMAWEYDPRTHKMELIQHPDHNGGGKDTVLKTMDAPDFTLLGDGIMGILPRKAYRAGGFSPAVVTPLPAGFQIIRWLYVEDYRGKKEKVSVQQVQEFVGTDGTYRRTVLKSHSPPSLPGALLSIPKFE